MNQATNVLEVVSMDVTEMNVNHVSFKTGMSLRDIEKNVILETLRRQRYNRTHTARVLGIGIRTLQRKLKQYREIEHGGILHLLHG